MIYSTGLKSHRELTAGSKLMTERGMVITKSLLLVLGLIGCATAPASGPTNSSQNIEFETSEVTAPDISLSPDGNWLIFSMLGHLFRLPVEGGQAEQLTFGPYYDSSPAYSADGSKLLFVSDRGGGADLFLLNLESGTLQPLTHGADAHRPVWTPDGKSIVFLQYSRQAANTWEWAGYRPMPALVMQIPLNGANPTALSSETRRYRSVNFLPDGSLVWAWVDWDEAAGDWKSHIETVSESGRQADLLTVEGLVDRMTVSPSGKELYTCLLNGAILAGIPTKPTRRIVAHNLGKGSQRVMFPGSTAFTCGSFALAKNGRFLVTGHKGKLWRINPGNAARSLIPFQAKVIREVFHRAKTDSPAPPADLESWIVPRFLSHPTMSSDGQRVYFEAAGYVFEKKVGDGSPARRLFPGDAITKLPALSPDGRSLAYIHDNGGQNEVRVFRFAGNEVQTVSSGAHYYLPPEWSPDGRQLLITEYGEGPPKVVVVDVQTRSRKIIIDNAGWLRRPHFSGDGQSVVYMGRLKGKWTVLEQPLEFGSGARALVDLKGNVSEVLLSADRRWLVLRQNPGLALLSLNDNAGNDAEIRLLTREIVENFALTPDSSAVLYSTGDRIRLQTLPDGNPRDIAVRLRIKRDIPTSLTLHHIRVLNARTHQFGSEVSMHISDGRIRWIGVETEQSIPEGTESLDAQGRFVIPGLVDFHSHAGWAGMQGQRALIAYGVTSVRDPGSDQALAAAYAARGAATAAAIPRYFYSGNPLNGAVPGMSSTLANAGDAEIYVKARKAIGAHFIKAYATLPWPLQAAVARVSRDAGLIVAGHALRPEEYVRGSIFGYGVMEHSFPVYNDVHALLAQTGIRWDPTLTLHMGVVLLLREQPERLTNAKLLAFSSPECRRLALESRYVVSENQEELERAMLELFNSVRAAHAAGVRIQAGTDDHGADWLCLPGISLHWELELLQRAGIPPRDILALATSGAAEALGVAHFLGSVEVGKAADLVILDANPLLDIRNTQSIWRVLKGGNLFDPDKLARGE